MDSTVSETGKAVPVWAAYKTDASVFDEMLDLASQPRSGCEARHRYDVLDGAGAVHRNLRARRSDVPPDGRDLQCLRRRRRLRAHLPLRSDSARHRRRHLGHARSRPDSTRARAQRLRRPTFTATAASSNDGVVPRDLVLGCPQFRRAAVGIKPPLGNFVTVARDRSRARRRRPLLRARRQRPHAERRFLRDRKSRRDDAPGARL